MKRTSLVINGIPALLFGEASEKVFLYVHGKKGNKEEAENFAREALAVNYQVLSFDLPDDSTVQQAVDELRIVYAYAAVRYEQLSLFACSIGAYFSLVSYHDIHFKKCLFLSPVLDMEHLIKNMMMWAHIDEDDLQRCKEIPTSFGEILSWDYYRYVVEHPVVEWMSPTSILYGMNDNITEKEVLDAFVQKFPCRLTVMKNGGHYFHTPEEMLFMLDWIRKTIGDCNFI